MQYTKKTSASTINVLEQLMNLYLQDFTFRKF